MAEGGGFPSPAAFARRFCAPLLPATDPRYARRMTAIPSDTPTAPAAADTRPRNRLGVVAFVLVIIVLVVPLVATIITAIVGAASGSTGGSSVDAAGWSILGGFILGAIALAVISPIAIVGVILAIISLFRRRGRNGLGVWALVLGILPAIIGPFLIPAALDTLF